MEEKMPLISDSQLLSSAVYLSFIKGAVLILAVFYAIFALMIVKQVDLMAKTLITTISPVIRDFAIYHAIFAIALIFLIWKFL